MAWILTRKRKDGVHYTAVVRVKGYATQSRTFASKMMARAWASQIETQLHMSRDGDPALAMQITLADALHRYLMHITPRKKETTRMRDHVTATALLRHMPPDIRLGEISPQVFARYKSNRLLTIKPATLQKEWAMLSHLFTIARKEWGIAVENPITQVEKPALRNGRARFLTGDEALRLIDACRKSRNIFLAPYILLLLHTGMRPSEAAGLRWRQVYPAERKIVLVDTKTRPRTVPMTQACADELTHIRPEDISPDDSVFLPVSDRMNPRPALYFRTAWYHARKLAGLPDVHLHDLRHTAASHLLMSGADIRTVAAILGHSTMQMVMRYTHLLDAHVTHAVEHGLGGLGIEDHTSAE